MTLDELVQTSAAVAATSGPPRQDRQARGAARAASHPTTLRSPSAFSSAGRARASSASAGRARPRRTSTPPRPSADARICATSTPSSSRSKSVRGKSSNAERARLLGELFARATCDEQRFLSALIVGEVRQGALEGVLLEAIAKAAGVPSPTVRRAAMMAGDLGVVARAALSEGEAGSRNTACSSSARCNRCSPTPRRPSPRRWPRTTGRSRSSGSSTARAFRCIARTIASRSTRAI